MSKRHVAAGLVFASIAAGCGPEGCTAAPTPVTVRIRLDRGKVFAPHQNLRVAVSRNPLTRLAAADRREFAIDDAHGEIVFTTTAIEVGRPYSIGVEGLGWDGCNATDLQKLGVLEKPTVTLSIVEDGWSQTHRGCSPPPWDPTWPR